MNSLLNAVGQGVPILVAIGSVPLLLRGLGTERTGLLTLSWSVIGYASLFDFGLGRALTQVVAERRHQQATSHDLPRVVSSALAAMLLIGCAAGMVMLVLARWAATSGLNVSPELQSETLAAARLLAIGIPIVVLTSGFRGILEGYERFDLANAVRVPIGISTFLGPVIAMPFTHSLAWAVGVLLGARVAGLVALIALVNRVAPELSWRTSMTRSSLGPVMRFGAWMTVSNILSPLMSSADRFFISAMISASVVAYYTAPYEMVTRLMAMMALAVATSLFPAFARAADVADARALLMRGLRLITTTFVPAIVLVLALAPTILRLWLGDTFARESSTVLRILAVGILMNGFAQAPFAMIQARGRADLTAKIHLAELPFYVTSVLYLIRVRGIEGAAIAWTLRVSVEAVVLFVVARYMLDEPLTEVSITEAI
ncbi:MAG TPA: flippase [Gemmatimonadaceae bacterium]|nr:flippase [Gemmatimonadaceae bacterium]